MVNSFEGKVALVTGASRGIGRAIAERLSSLGATVVIHYNGSASEAQTLHERLTHQGRASILVKGDMSKVADIEHVFDMSLSAFNKIDIVVANAGVEIVGKAAIDVTEEDFDRVFSVNAKGAFFTLQCGARHVEDGGRLLYIGSSTSRFPMPGHAVYGASKLAPCFLVEVLAKELGYRNVTVNSILPSATEGAGVSTNGIRESVKDYLLQHNPMRRAASLKDVADAVEFLTGQSASYISGQHLLLSGGAPA